MSKLQISLNLASFALANFFLLANYLLVKLSSKAFFNLFYIIQIVKFLLDNNVLLNKQL